MYLPEKTFRRAQGGAVLIVGLIMMLMMTIVALAAIRGSGMQEQMAGNIRNLNLAFQSAEGALREGESMVSVSQGQFDGTNGLHPGPGMPGAEPIMAANWSDADWQGGRAAPRIGDVAADPRYVVEEIPYRCDSGSDLSGQFAAAGSDDAGVDDFIYRVTSWGAGGTLTSTAVLQSTFIFIPCSS